MHQHHIIIRFDNLTLSWQMSLYIETSLLIFKSMDWFLCDRELLHERVNYCICFDFLRCDFFPWKLWCIKLVRGIKLRHDFCFQILFWKLHCTCRKCSGGCKYNRIWCDNQIKTFGWLYVLTFFDSSSKVHIIGCLDMKGSVRQCFKKYMGVSLSHCQELIEVPFFFFLFTNKRMEALLY